MICINDPYWVNNSKPETSSGIDLRGRNIRVIAPFDVGVGIDISAAVAADAGISGNTVVSWRGLPGSSTPPKTGALPCGCGPH